MLYTTIFLYPLHTKRSYSFLSTQTCSKLHHCSYNILPILWILVWTEVFCSQNPHGETIISSEMHEVCVEWPLGGDWVMRAEHSLWDQGSYKKGCLLPLLLLAQGYAEKYCPYLLSNFHYLLCSDCDSWCPLGTERAHFPKITLPNTVCLLPLPGLSFKAAMG